MEMRIGLRQMLQIFVMGTATVALGLPQGLRRQSLTLVTNSEDDDINVIDLEKEVVRMKVGKAPKRLAALSGAAL